MEPVVELAGPLFFRETRSVECQAKQIKEAHQDEMVDCVYYRELSIDLISVIDYGMEHGSCRGDAHEGKDGTFFVVIFRIIEVFCNHKTKHHHTYKGRNQEVNYLNGAVTGESVDNNGSHGSKIKENDPQKVNFLEFAVILCFVTAK